MPPISRRPSTGCYDDAESASVARGFGRRAARNVSSMHTAPIVDSVAPNHNQLVEPKNQCPAAANVAPSAVAAQLA